MKKIIQLLSVMCIVALLGSCSNDDTPSTTDDTQTDIDLVIKRISRSTTDPNSTCLGRYGEFSTEGRLERIYVCDALSWEFNYNDEDLIVGITGIGGFDYENNQLIGVATGNDTGSAYTFITYDDNRIIERAVFNGVESMHNRVYKFTDDTYSKLISITRNKDVDTNPYISSEEIFEYVGGNMVKSIKTRLNESTQVMEDVEVIDYLYDEKINPYQMGLTQNAHVTSRIISFFYLGPSEMLAAQSDNNVTKQAIWRKPLDEVYQFYYEYTYVYNEFDYPISYSVNNDDNEIISVGDFEYYE